MNNKNQKNNKIDLAGANGVRLYLKVHIMPTLNTPLRGPVWQWVSPFVAAAILVVAVFYFLAD